MKRRAMLFSVSVVVLSVFLLGDWNPGNMMRQQMKGFMAPG
jgi:hypothetical protein